MADWFAGIDTVAGTVTEGSLEVSVTTVGPVVLTTATWTEPVEVAPPTTDEGLTPSDIGFAAFTVSVPVVLLPLEVPVIVATVSVPTETVVAVKVAEVAPPATVTDAGTVTLLDDEVSVTVKPPAAAGLPSVKVPVELVPPVTVDGLNVIVPKVEAVIVNVAVAGVPLFADAPIVTVVADATERVVTVNVPVVAPAAIVAVAGTVAAEVLLEVRLTVRPPVGAALLIVIVPVELTPPSTDVGFKDRAVTFGAVIVKEPVADDELAVAVIVAVVFEATAVVVTEAVPDVAPAAIVSVPGTAEVVLEVSVTG